ncbi:sensor domain-containing protein [Amycolatopsis sacchari]|uniref:Putative sensor n=1 Tax=Amycolatopsis sacchari TaxID=115433 RepID=A0A1I3UQ20_9PSEU|nr:sensor domain-containing protein [Amycolatopsis sacchari]SFJ84863.1 Putative sensor [Amycolatopsis sacchari]
MTSASSVEDGSRPYPSIAGSLLYLLLNLPLGIAGFVGVTTLAAVGLTTAVVWIGVPVLALLVLGSRAAAQFERARAHALLGTYVVSPYRPLPGTGWRLRWRTRVLDGATWRDMGYFVLLLPLGLAEFVPLVVTWAAGLGLTALPIYFRYLPNAAFITFDGTHHVVIDSTVDALPWAALGLAVLALAIAMTRALGVAHARLVRVLLGPGPRARRIAEEPIGAVA